MNLRNAKSADVDDVPNGMRCLCIPQELFQQTHLLKFCFLITLSFLFVANKSSWFTRRRLTSTKKLACPTTKNEQLSCCQTLNGMALFNVISACAPRHKITKWFTASCLHESIKLTCKRRQLITLLSWLFNSENTKLFMKISRMLWNLPFWNIANNDHWKRCFKSPEVRGYCSQCNNDYFRRYRELQFLPITEKSLYNILPRSQSLDADLAHLLKTHRKLHSHMHLK